MHDLGWLTCPLKVRSLRLWFLASQRAVQAAGTHPPCPLHPRHSAPLSAGRRQQQWSQEAEKAPLPHRRGFEQEQAR